MHAKQAYFSWMCNNQNKWVWKTYFTISIIKLSDLHSRWKGLYLCNTWLFVKHRLEPWTICPLKPSKTLHPRQEKHAQRYSYLNQLNILSNHFWLQRCGENIFYLFSCFSSKDQSQRWRVVPWMYHVLHDLWENSIQQHHQSDRQAARHHRSFTSDWVSWHIGEGLAGCVEGERPRLNYTSLNTKCQFHKSYSI